MFGFGKKKAKKQEELAKQNKTSQEEAATLDPRQQDLFEEDAKAAPEDKNAPSQPKKFSKIDKLVMGAIMGAAVGSVIGMTVAPKKKADAPSKEKNTLFSSLKKTFFEREPQKPQSKSTSKATQDAASLKKIPNESD